MRKLNIDIYANPDDKTICVRFDLVKKINDPELPRDLIPMHEKYFQKLEEYAVYRDKPFEKKFILQEALNLSPIKNLKAPSEMSSSCEYHNACVHALSNIPHVLIHWFGFLESYFSSQVTLENIQFNNSSNSPKTLFCGENIKPNIFIVIQKILSLIENSPYISSQWGYTKAYQNLKKLYDYANPKISVIDCLRLKTRCEILYPEIIEKIKNSLHKDIPNIIREYIKSELESGLPEEEVRFAFNLLHKYSKEYLQKPIKHLMLAENRWQLFNRLKNAQGENILSLLPNDILNPILLDSEKDYRELLENFFG